MKYTRLILITLLCIVFLPSMVDADPLTYQPLEDDTVAIIGCDLSTSGALVIPSRYNGKQVTVIGYAAFSHCRKLTSVTIPESVTTIENKSFFECSSLTSVKIGNRVTYIGDEAFSGCRKLTSVTIPDRVSSIGNNAFLDCGNLTSIKVTKNNTKYSSQDGVLFNKNKSLLIQYPESKTGNYYNILNSVTSIKNHAFIRSALTSITIPNSVTSIGPYAFKFCKGLTSIKIPDSVTSIGSFAFSYCSSLTSVIIPDNVTSIGSAPLDGCTNLTSIEVVKNNSTYVSQNGVLFDKNKTLLIQYPEGKIANQYKIPDSVTSIGTHAFRFCESLTSITIPNSVTNIGIGAFERCYGFTKITIPDSVTSIGDAAFWECRSLKNINIPNSVTSIGDLAFYYCLNLNKVTIGNSVISIGRYAFGSCASLTSVVIPESVTSIGDDIFEDCSILSGIIFEGNAPSIDSSFTGVSDDAKVYVKLEASGFGDTYGGLPVVNFNIDSDSDGLTDLIEFNDHKTDPALADTDGDGLSDGAEVNDHKTNPLVADTDGDNFSDSVELAAETDPNDAASNPNVDSDGDGLTDLVEVNVHKTNPALADTDGDGLSDGAEVNQHKTNPLVADTDGDNFSDSVELAAGTDPNDAASNPNVDSDGDGLTDLVEVNVHKTNPALADTDGDGLSDGAEVNDHKTNPLVADTDGDNYSDSEEIAAGTDPNDNKSYPVKIKPPVITVSPESIYIKTNDDASFEIQATGTSISYQWFLDKKPIAGADSNTLIIPNVSKENEGNYTVEISNEAGTVSQDATLTLVEEPPVFLSVPNRFDTVFEKGETMILAPKVKSVGPTTFQWFKEGNKLEGETKLILKVNDVDYDDADNYTLDATNLFGTETSETMRVSIVNEANIGQHIDDEFPKVQGVIDSSPAVGKDGSIYYSTSGEKGYLYRHKSNGERKWRVSFNSGLRGSPAIDENEVIYVLEDAGALHAVKNEESRGKRLWRYKLTGGDVDAEGEYREFGNSPAIAEDGTVIFGWFDRNVYAVKDGKLVWKFPTEGRIVASPSIALDGTIYIGDDEGNLYAIKPDGTAVWPEPFDTKAQIMTRPAIDSEGNIYFGSFSGEFYALAPNGDLRWSFDTDQDIWTSAVIRADGTVYFGADDGYFYALNTETGKVKWTYRIKENWQRSSTAALGLDGSIYFTLWDNSFYSINRIGKKLWSIKLKGDGVDVATFSSPSLLDDGRIYVGIQDGKNSLINTIQGGSPIDSRSPWPSFGGDLQNTGRVVTSTSNKDSFRPQLRLINKENNSITMQVTGDAFEIYKLQYSSDLRSWKFEPVPQSIQTNYRGQASFKTSDLGFGKVFFRLLKE